MEYSQGVCEGRGAGWPSTGGGSSPPLGLEGMKEREDGCGWR